MRELQTALEEACERLAAAEAARSQWTNAADVGAQQVQFNLTQLKVGRTSHHSSRFRPSD